MQEFIEKVLQGVHTFVRKLIEAAASENGDLVVGDEDGNYKDVPAKELLQKLNETE